MFALVCAALPAAALGGSLPTGEQLLLAQAEVGWQKWTPDRHWRSDYYRMTATLKRIAGDLYFRKIKLKPRR